MKTLLGMVLGERPDAPYDPNRYSPSTDRPAPTARRSALPPPPPLLAPPRGASAASEEPRRLYGQGQPDSGGAAAQEAVPLGPWLLGPSTAGFWTPGGREIQEQTIPLQARTQIAVCSAPHLVALMAPSGPCALRKPNSSRVLDLPAAMRKRAADRGLAD